MPPNRQLTHKDYCQYAKTVLRFLVNDNSVADTASSLTLKEDSNTWECSEVLGARKGIGRGNDEQRGHLYYKGNIILIIAGRVLDTIEKPL